MVLKKSAKSTRKSTRSTRKSVRKDARKSIRKDRKERRKSVKKDSRKSVRKDTRKSVRKDTRKSVKKDTRKPAKKDARKSTKKPVKKLNKKDDLIHFELRFYPKRFLSSDSRESEAIRDVSSLPSHVKDAYNKYLRSLNFDDIHPNHITVKSVSFNKNKPYVSVMVDSEYPAYEVDESGSSLLEMIDAYSDKSVWQAFGSENPKEGEWDYVFNSVDVFKNGKKLPPYGIL